MTDINFLAQTAYDLGDDPIDWALALIQNNLEVHWAIRRFAPETCRRDFLWPSEAARILGDLMDAGWTPPEVTR